MKQQNNKVKMFVYGTLKSGYGNNILLQNERKIGNAETVDSYIMKAGGIPYVFKDKKLSTIKGELWEVDKDTLPSIDRLEGHPNWYKREKINVISNDKEHSAWIYFMQGNSDSSNLMTVENGKF